MKKLFVALILIFSVACSKNETTVEGELSNDEKILMMINQCIDDYNNDLIGIKEIEYNTTINPLPINIGKIENIKGLKDLKERNPKNIITSAVYTGEYKVNDYTMVFEIYNYGNNFWLDGESSFEIDVDSIIVDNPEFKEVKELLNNLIVNNRIVLRHLYGIEVEKGEEHISEKGFFEVLSPYSNIEEIKTEAEKVFTSDFLQDYYDISFNNEDPIYKEIDNKLYVSDTDITISEGLPYDTSRIIATSVLDDSLLVDIVITFGDDVSNEIQRITLINTENGYRLNNSY